MWFTSGPSTAVMDTTAVEAATAVVPDMVTTAVVDTTAVEAATAVVPDMVTASVVDAATIKAATAAMINIVMRLPAVPAPATAPAPAVSPRVTTIIKARAIPGVGIPTIAIATEGKLHLSQGE